MTKKKETTKIGRTAGKMLLWMFIGAVIGFIAAIGVYLVKGDLLNLAEQFAAGYQRWIWVLQTAVFVIGTGLALFFYRKAAALIKKGSFEDLDRADHWQGIAMTLNEVGIIFQFMLFGTGVGGGNPYIMLCTALFLLYFVLGYVTSALLIKQVQKSNPEKRGDVGSLKFEKQWLESCDEAERAAIYQISYKCFIVMKQLLPILWGVAMLGKLFFGTGGFPVVLVSLIWAVNTGTYCYYSNRVGKVVE